MRHTTITTCTLLISLFFTQRGECQIFDKTTAITTAMPSLLIPADPRSAAMGETGIATTADANSGYINLAKLPFAKDKAGIGISYTPWMSDVASGMYLLGASGFTKLKDDQVISASLRYFKMGTFELHDNNGVLLENASPSEFLFDIGYARKLSDKFGLGLTLRYMQSKLATGTYNGSTFKAGKGIAADISLLYNNTKANGEGFSAGFALANLGSKISFSENKDLKEFIPAKLGIGTAYTKVLDEKNNLLFALDINKLLVPENDTNQVEYAKTGLVSSWFDGFGNKAWRFSLGAEYNYDQLLSVRAGYIMEAQSQGGRKGFTAGIGLKYKAAAINFAYFAAGGSGGNRSPLAGSLKFGVLFGFK